MGILNITPDSFSDGGHFLDQKAAIDHGLAMIAEGADIIDVGGESTRPGAEAVTESEEIDRIMPVISEITRQSNVPVSVDTMKSEVARIALREGARIINDVSALTYDSNMRAVARETGAGVVLMHMKGSPRTMQKDPHYADVVGEVTGYLKSRLEQLAADGLDPETMAVDPGIGFGKTVEHNVALLGNMQALTALGRPVVIGASRKSFLGKLTGAEVDERLAPSLGALVYCVLNGAHVIRVHDVGESRRAATVALALADARKP